MTRALILIALVMVGCERPRVSSGAAQRDEPAARIEGTVVASTIARGKVVLFLYDATRPPPPRGTGRPLTFSVVGRDALFSSAPEASAGPFTAPFAFSQVLPGRYLIRAVLDADDDFIPWYGVTSDATQGDVGGGVISLATRALVPVEVTVDEAGRPRPALEVPVTLQDAATAPLDRPVFEAVGGIDVATVDTQPVSLELAAIPISEGVVKQEHPGFLLRVVDDNGDGVPDDANGDGAPDLWPRVVVRKLSEQPLRDENDLDNDGVPDETGLEYEHVDGTVDGVPDVVVLGAAIDPTAYLPLLFDAQGKVLKTPLPVARVTVRLAPLAFDAVNPAAPARLRRAPPGRYAITLIQETGQTWRVPNELSPELAGTLGLPSIPSQRFTVLVK